MANHTRRVGLFTDGNIATVLRALSETSGTYREVVRQAS